jgi:hypothetical protein
MIKPLSRRTVLRGLGTALALPWLEAMLPRESAAAPSKGGAPPLRIAWFYVPNGIHMPDWTPNQEGRNFDLPPILKPLGAHRNYLTVLSGLTLNGARPLGDGAGDHARSVAAFLTGAHPRKTDGANIQNGVSIDQVAAERAGQHTRFGSLELGCERSAGSGDCDSGYSCAYSSNISWRTPTSPVAKEVNPQAAFDRLFGSGTSADQKKGQTVHEKRKRSILDFARDDAEALKRRLGSADQRKLDEYLYAVRDVEKRIGAAPKLESTEKGVPDYPRPAGVPHDFAEHLKQLMDILVLALQTDSTRFVTFMYTNDSSNRSYTNLGIKDGHHDLSHHSGSHEKQAKISRINVFHMEQFAYLIGKLKEVKEAGGTLLDHSLIMYGAGIADGNAHEHGNLPILLLGKGNGALPAGRHLRVEKETPLCNLYLWMLHRLGVRADKFGDSTGRLDALADRR